MRATLERLLGGPVELVELKRKPGRRRTLRATGPCGRAIVKIYATPRAGAVADRLGAIQDGPAEPRLPQVLHVDPDVGLLVLSEVDGEPLRYPVLSGDRGVCHRTGQVLAGWHRAWRGRPPDALPHHTAGRELEALSRQASLAPDGLGHRALEEGRELVGHEWACATVVHRDLYEEQILLGPDGGVGLIDLDDAAAGPPELDVGNLLAHLELLAVRTGRNLQAEGDAVLDGYLSVAPSLDGQLLERCRRLTLLRLACIHRRPELTV